MKSVISSIVVSLSFLLISCSPPQSVQNQNTAKSSKIQQVSSGWSLEVSMVSWTQENTATSPLSSGALKYEVINGISVPPEPDVTLNNATIAWVDVNNNGVRDDVERYIALQFWADTAKYESATNYVKAEQYMLSSNRTDEYIRAVRCKLFSTNEANSITKLMINNKERSMKYGENMAGALIQAWKEGC